MTAPFNLKYRSKRLNNGVNVLVQPDHRTQVISFQTWIAAGSAQDPQHRTGMAHLFEHLMFKGTDAFPEGVFDREIEAIGGRTNAATWLDWTQFYVDAPSHAFDRVLELEFDRFSNLTVDDERLELERDVVLNERGEHVDDDPDGLMAEHLWAMAFGEHPYGQPTIGWESHIRDISLEDCQTFYERWYQPDALTVVVAGDIEAERVFDAVEASYGRLSPRKRVDTSPSAFSHPPASRDTLEVATGSERLLLGFRSPRGVDPDNAALEVLNEILFGGDASRAERALVIDGEVAVGVFGFIPTLREPGLYEIGVDCRPERRAEDALSILESIFEDIVTRGVTEEEVLRARNRIETRFFRGLQTSQSRAQALGYWNVVAGNPDFLFERARTLVAVESSDIKRVAQEIFTNAKQYVLHGTPLTGGADT